MPKTVNASFTIVRDGLTTTHNMAKLPYGRFVTLQVALSASLVQLLTYGVGRLADTFDKVPEVPSTAPKRTDLSFRLEADHGAGTSKVELGYTGLEAHQADEITALALASFKAVV